MGQRGVALLDRFEIASQTSPRAAGLTQQIRPTEEMTRLAMLAVEKITRFAEETGEPMVYHQSGSVKNSWRRSHTPSGGRWRRHGNWSRSDPENRRHQTGGPDVVRGAWGPMLHLRMSCHNRPPG